MGLRKKDGPAIVHPAGSREQLAFRADIHIAIFVECEVGP
jgi:hypothetical protein